MKPKTILDKWLQDIPQQFQGKRNIEVIISAFAKQLQEIEKVFGDLNHLTDIDNAVGQNLDMVGNIVSLTRKDATTIIRKANDDVLTDDIYRQTLRYKILKNSSDCTYEDIMGAVSLLWDTNNITYKEPRGRPATVLLSLPTVSLDSIDPAIGRILSIKPAGVAVIYTVGYWSIIPLYLYDKFLIPRMSLLWKFVFYDFAMKEINRLDGSWLLDGSVQLNVVKIDIPIHMNNHGIATDYHENIDMDWIARVVFRNVEAISNPKNILRIEIEEFKKALRSLDGTWNLSGEYLLNEQRWYLPMIIDMYMGMASNKEYGFSVGAGARCSTVGNCESSRLHATGNSAEIPCESSADARTEIRAKTGCIEDISCSLVTKKNIWYLNGSLLLDGNRYLNAIEIKEVI